MHAQLIATALALAGSALAGTSSSISFTKVTTTSVVSMFDLNQTVSTTTAEPVAEHTAACTVCPKDFDRNWNADSVLNDTRKHHSGFKLFAYKDDMPEVGFPLHVLSHKEDRKGMWQFKFGNPLYPNENAELYQPKWNLHDKSLQTDGSTPINKTLYFRLYNGDYPRDTENWIGIVYHTIATASKRQKEYKKENNAELIAKKGWSLEREADNPLAYILKGSKPDGNFFACIGEKNVPEDVLPLTTDSDEAPDVSDLLHVSAFLDNLELVYSAEQPKHDFETPGNSVKERKGCVPVTIKVCC
jgi:hypothetical protein